MGVLKSVEASVVCLAETNTDWKHPDAHHRVFSQFRMCFNQVKMAVSHSGLKQNSIFQPGGTTTAVVGKWSGRFDSKGSNKKGGFSWIVMRGRRGRRIVIITCYRVSQVSSVGLEDTNTAFIQQQTILRKSGLQSPCPRKECLAELATFIMMAEAKGHEVILSIDANEAVDSYRSALPEFLSQTTLVDTISHAHGEMAPKTYLRGQRRIDFVFASESLLPHLRRSGHLGILDAIPSDHVGIWLEFDGTELFRGATENLGSIQQKPFTMRDTTQLKTFTDTVEKHLVEQSVESRLGSLQRSIPEGAIATPLHVAEYEKIARDVDAAMKAGIAASSRKNVGFHRSPALTDAASIVRYWRLQLTACRNKIGLSEKIIRFASKHDLPQMVVSIESIHRALHDAWEDLRAVQQKAQEHRAKWLNEKADAVASQMKTDRSTALRQIAAENATKSTFQRLRPISKGTQTGALTRIKVPKQQWYFSPSRKELYEYRKGAFYAHAWELDDDDSIFRISTTRKPLPTTNVYPATVMVTADGIVMNDHNENDTDIWREVTDSEELVALLLERNADHLRQSATDGTPFTTQPLLELFGLYGTTDAADRILRGEFDLTTLPISEEAIEWMKQLVYEDGKPDDLDVSISDDHFRSAVKGADENTSASPSGFGYVVWKACGLSPIASKVHSIMMSLPFQHGFSPSRWRQCLEVMLEKDAGNPLIHRLRIIVLLEADFNIALRIIWMRRLFPAAEKMGFVPEQWGSRKNRNSTDCATMKMLTFESCRHRRTWVAMMAMDAAACYDRILTYMSSLCERRHGLPKNACIAKGKTVFEMLRRVRTAYGESDGYYTSVGDDLLHGECQGKTSSPPSWAIYTITLIRALAKYNPGITVQCVEATHIVHRLADMFVDDKDMWTQSLAPGAQDEKMQLLTSFQRAAQAWERILFASGGLLALHKCYWWMVGWRWEQGMPVLLTPAETDVELCLENGNDKALSTIKQMGPDDANVGLGFRMTPSGTQQPEIKFRIGQSDKIAARLQSSRLTPNESWVLYSAIYNATIYFPAKISSYTQVEWSRITSRAIMAFLPKMGFNRHMKRDLAFAPRSYGGVGLTHGYAQQGAEGLCHLLTHLRWKEDLGTLMLAVLSQLQLLSGRGDCLLEYTAPSPKKNPKKGSHIYKWHHLGIGWFQSLRFFLNSINGSLHIRDLWRPKPVRAHDSVIMDAFAKSSTLDEFQLAQVNSVRLWIRALTVADISDAGGRNIEAWARSGRRRLSSSLDWPIQSEPSPAALMLWRKCLRAAYSPTSHKNLILTRSLPLRINLGRWTAISHVKYDSYWDEDSLYLRTPTDTFTKHKPTTLGLRDFEITNVPTTLPSRSTPVTYSTYDTCHHVHTFHLSSAPIPQRSPPTNIISYIQRCPPQERRILGVIHHHSELLSLIPKIFSQQVLFATDGSFDPHLQRATGSWCIASKDGTRRAFGSCPVDGDLSTLDSFRAELEAVRCLIYVIRMIIHTHNITIPEDWSIEIWIDNTSALRYSCMEKLFKPGLHLGPESDIISDIITIRTELNLTLRGNHVHSHQNLKPGDPVPLEVQLNEGCDKHAGLFRKNADRRWRTRPTATSPPSALAALSIDNKLVTNNYRTRLIEAYSSIAVRKYLLQRQPTWTESVMDTVDWYHLGIALTSIFKKSKSDFSRFVKFMNSMSNTGVQKHLFSKKSKTLVTDSDKCPCCKNEAENTMHLFNCKNGSIQSAITTSIETLFKSLQRVKIPLDMWLTIRAGMGTFLGRETYEMPTTTGNRHYALQQAYDDQTTIGWGNFLKGRIADSWGHLMTQTYVTLHKNDMTQSRRRFQTTLITGIWTIFDNIWKLRNAMLHNPEDVSSLSNLAVNKRIKAYYHRPRLHLSSSDQHLLRRSLSETLQRSISKKRAWLRVVDIRKSIYLREHNDVMRNIPTLDAFFDTYDPPPP